MLEYNVYINGRLSFTQAFPDHMSKAEIVESVRTSNEEKIVVTLVK